MSPKTSPGAPNAVRGIVIVVVAGVLGLVLLARGGTTSLFDDGEPVAANTHVTSTTGNVPTIAPAPTTVAAPTDTKPPAGVKVAVFNGTAGAITGAAGDAQSKLTPLGYENVTLADAPQAIEATAVYYAAGFEQNATAIAQALGYDPGVVAPAQGATNNPGEGQGASVVVVIGTDAAANG